MGKFIRELHGVTNHVNSTTINFGSILVMKLVDVIPDRDNYCMYIPIQILKVLNADSLKSLGILVILYQELCERLTSGVRVYSC
jgi:hypothetical protein